MRLALALSLALALAAGAYAATGVSGLHGVVKQATSPVCADGVPCDGLARGVTLVFRRAGHMAVRATTRDDGTYRVRLAPSRYAVRIGGRGNVAALKPAAVIVRRGRVSRVDFVVGTGIRRP